MNSSLSSSPGVTNMKAKKKATSNDYNLEELREIRNQILGTLDFLDEELDNQLNETDLNFNRTECLRQYELCQSILEKTVRFIRKAGSTQEES
jgi:hypothetical protein